MIAYVVRRTLISVPVLWGVLTGTFFAFRLVPGDPTTAMVFGHGGAADRSRLRHELGLDRPVIVQYWNFLRGAVHFDFGRSILTNQTVWHEISIRFPYTLELAVCGFVLAVAIGIVAGVISALFNRAGLGITVTVLAV